MVISQRRSQKTLIEQAASKTQGNAACDVMEAATLEREGQAETRRLFEPRCQEAAEGETIYSGAIKDTLEKTRALQKRQNRDCEGRVLGDHRADIFKTLLDRQEETQKHLNELSAQLSPTRTTQKPAPRRKKSKRQAHAPAGAHM